MGHADSIWETRKMDAFTRLRARGIDHYTACSPATLVTCAHSGTAGAVYFSSSLREEAYTKAT